jgi:hypothetical protein
MKELLTILEALHNAQDALGRYAHRVERDPEATIDELLGILDNEELNCALERVEANVGSPPIAPDTAPVQKASIER